MSIIKKNLEIMILEQFSDLQAFAMQICRNALSKISDFFDPNPQFLHHLIRSASALTGYPIEYMSNLDMVYYGQIHFPKQGTQEEGPIILATSLFCKEDEIEMTIGHEIGHILIVYYNSLHICNRDFKKMTLKKQFAFLSDTIVLVDKDTGKKFPEKWFKGFEAGIRSTEAPIDNMILLRENRNFGEIDEKDIQELLCEEIGLFLIEERKRNEQLLHLKENEKQLLLF